VTNIYTDTENV